MIGHFPIPYPDELVYSICARFSDRVHYRSPLSVLEELLGTKTGTAIAGLPTHLAHLVANLPPGYPATVDGFIDQHTLLPFYAPFLLTDNLRRLYADMRSMNAKGVQGYVSAATSGLPMPKWLRFCPMCVEADREQWGECYWHRAHQISGVAACPTHAVWLEQSNERIRFRKQSKEFVPAERAIRPMPPRPLNLSNTGHQMALQLARDAHWLLHQVHLPTDLETLQKRYRVVLIHRDLATPSGLLHRQKIWREFRSYYPPELSRLLNCDLDKRITALWLSHLVHDPRRLYHPIHHLLMIHFLGYSLSEFLGGGMPTEYRPFGEEPWPCLNPASDHYLQPVIRECPWTYRRYEKSVPIGTFTCPLCGFVYTRRGPDRVPEDRFRRCPSIKTCGPVWEAALRRLWNTPSTNLDQIGRRLGIGRELVRKYAAYLDLPSSRPGNPKKVQLPKLIRRANDLSPTPLPWEDYRARWLAHVKEHPGIGRSKLARANWPVYHWLRRFDPEWLESNMPPCATGGRPPWHANWEERDRQLADEVEKIATSIRNVPGCPTHVNRSFIGRETGKQVWLYDNLDVLPLTARVLSNVIETREDWSVRKIAWAVEQYLQESLCPSRTKLMQRANITFQMAQHPQVRAALDAALHQLSQ